VVRSVLVTRDSWPSQFFELSFFGSDDVDRTVEAVWNQDNLNGPYAERDLLTPVDLSLAVPGALFGWLKTDAGASLPLATFTSNRDPKVVVAVPLEALEDTFGVSLGVDNRGTQVVRELVEAFAELAKSVARVARYTHAEVAPEDELILEPMPMISGQRLTGWPIRIRPCAEADRSPNR
jgi:hypothetical protein